MYEALKQMSIFLFVHISTFSTGFRLFSHFAGGRGVGGEEGAGGEFGPLTFQTVRWPIRKQDFEGFRIRREKIGKLKNKM